MTDDGFHSQTPLLFDQVGAVESVGWWWWMVGLGQLEGWGEGGWCLASSYTCSGFDNLQTSGMSGIPPPVIPRRKDRQERTNSRGFLLAVQDVDM